jgi:hypothetical protein
MARQIQINLGLNPVLNFDGQTNRFIIYYKEFPQAIATGINEDEAENNLIYLVEDMWRKRPDDLKKLLTESYMNQIRINPSATC